MENDKPAKAPGALKKPLKEKVLEKRYVKYIEHPGDRQFFTGCFDKQEGVYLIRSNLTKDDVKKLKDILGWVKKNKKSSVKFVPLAFAGIVAAALVIFFTVFANPLLGRALEMGLEAAFGAKSDVRNFRLSLIHFTISMNSITVANRDKPMTNLFEVGRTVISMKPEAVLRGKIYIEEISAAGMQFGSERTTSGTLPGKPPRVKEEKPKPETPPLVDLKNFDAKALLEQEYDKLNSPKIYDEAIAAYTETREKWENQVNSARGRVNELKTASAPLINLNVNNLRDVDTITKTIQDISTMINTVQNAADDAATMVRGIETDVNRARSLEQNARNAVTSDINHLKSYIDLESGTAFAALEPFIRDILSDAAEEYLDYGKQALEILEMLKEQADMPKTAKVEKPKKEKKIGFKGRDVIFPVVSYPVFYLGKFSSDVTNGSWTGDFDLQNISSDPEMTYRQTGKPITITIGATENSGSLSRKVRFDGSADLRASPNDNKMFDTKVTGGGFPLAIGNRMSNIGINGLTGETDFTVSLAGFTGGGVTSNGNVSIKQARLLDPKGTIAEATAAAVGKVGQIDLGIQYIHYVDKDDVFRINSNLANLLAEALKNIVQAYAKKAMDEIERLLRERIEQYIDGRFVSKEQVDALFAMARGDKAAVDTLKNSLTSKRNEFENRIKSLANEAAQQAKNQAEQAAKDALQGKTPTLTVPKLPSTGGLKLPGR